MNNYITIELIDEPSSIIIINKDASPKGKVTGVGSKVKDIEVGEIIYYRAKTGHEFNGQHFIKAEEILGKANG